MAGARAQLFREQAVRHAAEQRGGDVLRLSPGWTRWTYWVLVAVFAASVLYAVFGTLHEYASGPAVVLFSGRVQVTATVPGTVSSIHVHPGQKVEAGQILVRFASSVELAELERFDREFDLLLARSLRDPSDQAARACAAGGCVSRSPMSRPTSRAARPRWQAEIRPAVRPLVARAPSERIDVAAWVSDPPASAPQAVVSTGRIAVTGVASSRAPRAHRPTSP